MTPDLWSTWTRPLHVRHRVRFVPLVVETSGAWELEAAKVLVQNAGAVASREGEDPAALHAELLQELSVAVRSFRAKAALRRRAELAETSAPGMACCAPTGGLRGRRQGH